MIVLLRVVIALSGVSVLLLAYLALNHHLPGEYTAVALGLCMYIAAIEILVSRRNFKDKYGMPLPAGTAGWKGHMYVLVLFSALTILPVALMLKPAVARYMAAVTTALALTVLIRAIRRVEQEKKPDADPRVMHNADIYRAYGRTAQADSLLEQASDKPVAHGNDNMPILVRALGIGMIATSISCVGGFLLIPGTWMAEVFNSPSRFVQRISPFERPYDVELASAPAEGSILFWIIAVAALYLTRVRFLASKNKT